MDLLTSKPPTPSAAVAHLTYAERIHLHELRRLGHSMSHIGRAIGKSKSTVSRELRRNQNPDRSYNPHRAHRKALDRRKETKKPILMEQPEVHAAVTEKLHIGWSPQQIEGRLRRESSNVRIGRMTIYRYLDALPKDHPHRRAMRRRGRRNRRAKPGFLRRSARDHRSIHDRPKVADQRKRIGDWEIDLMVCGARSGYLVTAVERRSGYLLMRKVRDKTSARVNEGILRLFEGINRGKIKTLTFDNGPEFYHPRVLEKEFGCKAYFCDPYNSGQRGTNENTNGLARQYLRKGLPYGCISYHDVRKVRDRLNHRPRLRLHYQTPAEVFLR